MTEILLDQRMLPWVFIPIIYVTFLIMMFRFYFNLYTAYTTEKKTVKSSQYTEVKDKLTVAKCDNLAKKSILLTKQAFDSRKGFLCKPETGYLITEGDRPPVDSAGSMMAMQGGMMDGMKGMFVMMLTTMPVMAWINSFFAGFVLAKVPFSLTQKFRGMTQSGIDMENLDVSYVSSVSFYFLIVFGLNQINSLFLSDDDSSEEGQNAVNEQKKQMQMGMNPMSGGGMMGAAAGGQGKEQKQIFKPQMEGLQLVNHAFVLDNSHKLALSRLTELLKQ